MKFIKKLYRDEAGATAIEYGLIAALIAVAAISAMQGLGSGPITLPATDVAAIAQGVVRVSLDWVRRAFAEEHGTVPGSCVTVLGLGRLGVRDLTASSDLDIVVLYEFDEERRTSTGPRPLDAVVYYTRLTQRLVSALTAPTRRGRLYSIDMRLRPSGTKGPLASQFTGFLSYHQGEAELLISKHRNGGLGTVPLVFQHEYPRFRPGVRDVERYAA